MAIRAIYTFSKFPASKAAFYQLELTRYAI